MTIAVFVMEIGLNDSIPTYSGGLGILAGDLAYSFADLGIPATFVTLLSRNGYTSQKLDVSTGQADSPQPWDWRATLTKTGAVATLEVGERTQKVAAWEYAVKGKKTTKVLFLDTDIPGNEPDFVEATNQLYSGGQSSRLLQDMVLGTGGYRVLKALGLNVEVYHLNESHAAFAVVELLRDFHSTEAVRRRCVFTTHTPVAAGNDAFPIGSVREAFRSYRWMDWDGEASDGWVSLSRLAGKYSGVTNAVSLKHKFVSKEVIGHNDIAHVTNGVYHRRWVCPEVNSLFDKHLPGWEETPALLAGAGSIPSEELKKAHGEAKSVLVSFVNKRTALGFAEDVMTVTVAKRFTAYKRNGMLFSDISRLGQIAKEAGHIQVIIAGKAHPMDGPAKKMLVDVMRSAEQLNRDSTGVRVAVMENYDIEMAKLLVSGSDVWLNNPVRPLEACGTSGMKAGMNGVLNLSVYDGWWQEAGIDGVNGWGIGRRTEWADTSGPGAGEDENALYQKLADTVVPLYYGGQDRWTEMSKASIATSGPLFNSYRMARDYVAKVYARAASSN